MEDTSDDHDDEGVVQRLEVLVVSRQLTTHTYTHTHIHDSLPITHSSNLTRIAKPHPPSYSPCLPHPTLTEWQGGVEDEGATWKDPHVLFLNTITIPQLYYNWKFCFLIQSQLYYNWRFSFLIQSQLYYNWRFSFLIQSQLYYNWRFSFLIQSQLYYNWRFSFLIQSQLYYNWRFSFLIQSQLYYNWRFSFLIRLHSSIIIGGLVF